MAPQTIELNTSLKLVINPAKRRARLVYTPGGDSWPTHEEADFSFATLRRYLTSPVRENFKADYVRRHPGVEESRDKAAFNYQVGPVFYMEGYRRFGCQKVALPVVERMLRQLDGIDAQLVAESKPYLRVLKTFIYRNF